MTYQELFEQRVRRGHVSGENLSGICPLHDDHKASFSGNIKTGLWLCFACGQKGTARQFAHLVGADASSLQSDQLPQKELSPEELKNLDSDRRAHFYTWESDLTATYDYVNEKGDVLLYQVCKFVRVEDGRREKWFIPRRSDPDAPDGWCYVNVLKSQRVLYHLAELAESQKVYMPEGEADADMLHGYGLTATAYPGGAQFAVEKHPDLLMPLTGKDVVLLPDNDDPGRKAVSDHLLPILRKIARSVSRVDLPGTPEHEDISWWLTDGNHTIEEFLALPETVLKPPPVEWQLTVHLASEVEPRAVQWFLKGYIPLARPVLVQGSSGQGKTWFAQALLTSLSVGRWPFGLHGQGPAVSLYLFSEDDMHEDVVPRLRALGADLSHILLIPRPVKHQQNGRVSRFSLDDLPVLGREIKQSRARLVILDPIQAFLPSGINMNRVEDVRPIMQRLYAFAQAHQIGLVCVRHHAKSKTGSELAERGSGSQEWYNASRSSIVVVERKADYDYIQNVSHHSALALKINSAPTPREALDFSLGPESLQFLWTGLTSRTQEELAGRQDGATSEQRGTIETLQPFILTRLRQHRCPLSELIAVVRDTCGISKAKAFNALMSFKSQHPELVIGEERGVGGKREPAWSLADTPKEQEELYARYLQ